MPIYDYRCKACGKESTLVQSMNGQPPSCCEQIMNRVFTPPAMIRIKGHGYPSRRKWMRDWTPQSSPFSTGSLHGERY